MSELSKKNNIFFRNFLKGLFSVTTGSIVIKISILFLNITLLNNVAKSESSDIAKIFSLGLSSSSLLYLSSSRYIAKEYLKKTTDLKKLLKMAFSVILVVSFIALFLLYFIYSEKKGMVFVFTLFIFIFLISFFDLLMNVANAIGLNKFAALGQVILSLSLFFSIFLANINYDLFLNLVVPLFLITSVIASLYIYMNLMKVPLIIEIRSNLTKASAFKDMMYYSLPLMLGNIFFNPLILWSVSEISGINNKDFILFLASMNMLGIAMLLPGQVNTVSFSFLAKNESNINKNFTIIFTLLFSALISVLIINFSLPYLGFIYGSEIENILIPVFWITLCVFPFVIIQYCSSRLFLSGNPWSDALSNMLFGIIFVVGCFFIRQYEFGIKEISMLLLFCYILRLICIGFLYFNKVKA